METYAYYADGRWLEPAGGEYFTSENPYTGKTWAQIPRCNDRDVEIAVQAAYRACHEGPWARMHPAERGTMVRRLGDAVALHADRLADIETRDNGKRRVDIHPGLSSWLIDSFYYYAGMADKLEGSVIPTGRDEILNYTRHEPYGVVAAITAWNSPLLIAIWKLAPALAAGNAVILKPSEFASASTLELMKAFEDADLPSGVINTITGFGAEVGEPLVTHDRVRKVSFTGSVKGGASVAGLAARSVKSVTMELGGKSPQLVFDDARLEDSVHGVCGGIFPPAGQSCIAGSRLLLQAGIYDAFVGKLIEVAQRARLGDPNDPATNIGPIANKIHFERVLGHIERARKSGATLACGGNAVNPGGAGGWFIEPTIFTNVAPDSALAREEIFGPVLAVMRFETEDEAVQIANDTDFGLAAGIWTEDHRRALNLANRLEAGTVYLNNYFDACTQSPVGGYKQSGYGRENGWEGMRDFVQTKSVWLSTARRIEAPF
ncbi:MAG: aldehyde dehydrogenase [Gammaproteobacteria bacterium]|nr:aldehyde dehydrogenase [Gammaproteobacteria bacterium]MDH3447906.1 aldehyde dehydrogenase [Gammaproteobacteria bacterium]